MRSRFWKNILIWHLQCIWIFLTCIIIQTVYCIKTMLSDSEHPNPVKRKGKLFAIVDKDEYDFDTIDGNHLYGGFLDVYDEYRDQVFLKKRKRKIG